MKVDLLNSINTEYIQYLLSTCYGFGEPGSGARCTDFTFAELSMEWAAVRKAAWCDKALLKEHGAMELREGPLLVV